MTEYYNRKYNFTVKADQITPGKPYEGFADVPEFGKLFAEFPETFWLIDYKNTKMLVSDELFHRFFVREPAHA